MANSRKYTNEDKMPTFKTFEDILDFAILQEKAARQFYCKLIAEATDPDMRLHYKKLAEDEGQHEKELLAMKKQGFKMAEPDIKMLNESGYLKAMQVRPDMTLKESIKFSIKKEKSAVMLYSVLAESTKNLELAGLFRKLSEQEQQHADIFQKQLEKI